MAKTVWILGAGFSKPLGGPLLRELFSEKSLPYVVHTLRRRAPEALMRLKEWPAACIPDAYRLSGPRENRDSADDRNGPVRWSDAEDFLAQLDLAAQEKVDDRDESARDLVAQALAVAANGRSRDYLLDAPSKSRAADVLAATAYAHAHDWYNFIFSSESDGAVVINDDAIRKLDFSAKRWFAAECSAFVANAVLGSEAWEPYKRWYDKLGEDDIILSYNYDLVLEKLNATGNLKFVLPGGANFNEPNPRVFKVHGSVNWEAINDFECEEREKEDFFAVHCHEEEMAICTPGPSKTARYQQWMPFIDLAYSQISDADQIVFLGYRAPESDTYSLTRLVSAIKSNAKELGIWVILGIGGDSGIHAERLVELLKSVSARPRVVVERLPMFAQDFLVLYATNRFVLYDRFSAKTKHG